MTLVTSACCFAPQQEATRGPSTQARTLTAQLGLWMGRRDCNCATSSPLFLYYGFFSTADPNSSLILGTLAASRTVESLALPSDAELCGGHNHTGCGVALRSYVKFCCFRLALNALRFKVENPASVFREILLQLYPKATGR